VKESWDADVHPRVAVSELVEEASASGAPICVITGGEPAMHDLTALTAALQSAGLRTHIETSGVHPMTGSWDWVTLSPKRFKPALAEVYAAVDELKVIVVNRHDLAWGEEHATRLSPSALRFFQAEWDRRDRSTPQILAYLEEHPSWRLSVQVHKYIGVR
jgi:organic radical activating enzyme